MEQLGKLLRVRKDLPTTIPVAIAQKNWCRIFQPLFQEHDLVQQSLVELRTNNIIAKENKHLRDMETMEWKRANPFADLRPKEREGIYLADDDYGLLVTDMMCGAF